MGRDREMDELDDVVDYGDVRGYLPQTGAFRVLMTTRVRMQTPVKRLELGVLEIGDAIDLLLQTMGSPLTPLKKGGTGENGSEVPLFKGDLGGSQSGEPTVNASLDPVLEAAKELCEWLGQLPLAIELVGRYLAETGMIAGVLALDERARRVLGLVSVFAIAPIELGWVVDCLAEMEDVGEILDRVLVRESLRRSTSRYGDESE